MVIRKLVVIFIVLLLFPFAAAGAESSADTSVRETPPIVMETSMGTIKIELFDKEAPLTTENFRNYVNQNFYNGLIFHRVIPNFMIQGGGFEAEMNRRNPTRPPVPNEATNGLKNNRGTVAMARTSEINSATSQFFINVVNNASLDNRGTRPHEFGYAVFGKVVEGMDVVDKIAATPTTTVRIGGGQFRDVPMNEVTINRVYEERPEKSE
ncbi:MAG: peptidylprolyl isomerase [Desulfurivibrionaceae bacterium]|nr:peptidylprolyl isomerase [Desulfurivibrionaceae bacterium]